MEGEFRSYTRQVIPEDLVLLWRPGKHEPYSCQACKKTLVGNDQANYHGNCHLRNAKNPTSPYTRKKLLTGEKVITWTLEAVSTLVERAKQKGQPPIPSLGASSHTPTLSPDHERCDVRPLALGGSHPLILHQHFTEGPADLVADNTKRRRVVGSCEPYEREVSHDPLDMMRGGITSPHPQDSYNQQPTNPSWPSGGASSYHGVHNADVPITSLLQEQHVMAGPSPSGDQAMSVSLPAGYIPKECDWYEREAGFTVSDLVGRICKDSDGRWWPLTLSVSNIMTPPKVTVGTVTARFQVAEKGTGQLILIGADESDFYIVDHSAVVLAFLRLRCEEIASWFGRSKEKGFIDSLRQRTKDVLVWLVPIEVMSQGYSGSVATFLAVLRLYTNCVLRPNVAVTGVMSLSGYVLKVGSIVEKVKGALEQKVDLVLVPRGNERDLQGKLTPTELARCRFVSLILEVLEHAVEGFSRSPQQDADLYSTTSVSAFGFCHVGVITNRVIEEPGKEPTSHQDLTVIYSEAAAIPCEPHEPREVVLGLGAQPSSNIHTAIKIAKLYLEDRYDLIEGLISRHLHKKPYIDFTTRHRLTTSGREFSRGNNRNMELLYHIPSSEKGDWRLYGYPWLNYDYIEAAQSLGICNFLVDEKNAQQIVKDVTDKNMTLEGLGVRVLGCRFMEEMICWAILKKDPKEVFPPPAQAHPGH